MNIMKKGIIYFLLCCVYGIFAQNKPFPQNTKYDYGFLANASSFNSGDAIKIYKHWIAKYYEELKNDKARIKWDGGGYWKGIEGPDLNYSASEGIGYGLILTSYHGDKSRFDKLLGFYNFTIDYKVSKLGGIRTDHLMPWLVNKEGIPCDGEYGCINAGGVGGMGGAIDGDLDAAMALIIAFEQWKDQNYLKRAREIIGLLKNKYMVRCSEADNRWVLKPGDFAGCGDEVKSVDKVHDMSYYMPGYFRVFASVSGDMDWNQLADDSYYHLTKTPGILPSDWQRPNGTKPTGESAYRIYDYSYDASRIPWRLALDYSWHGTPVSATWLNKVTDWVNTSLGGPQKITNGYTKEGIPLKGRTSVSAAFTGAFTIGSMSSSQETVDNFALELKKLYYKNCPDIEGKSCDIRYFDLTLLAMYALNITGNFWEPKSKEIFANGYSFFGELKIYNSTIDKEIVISGNLNKKTDFKLYSLKGTMVSNFTIDSKKQHEPFKFTTNTLRKGLYFLVGNSGDKSIATKIMIP